MEAISKIMNEAHNYGVRVVTANGRVLLFAKQNKSDNIDDWDGEICGEIREDSNFLAITRLIQKVSRKYVAR